MTETKYRDVELTLRDPTVRFEVGMYGNARARLYAHRTTPRGIEETYIIDLVDLDVQELACVAESSTKALRQQAYKEKQRVDIQVQHAREAWL